MTTSVYSNLKFLGLACVVAVAAVLGACSEDDLADKSVITVDKVD